MSYYLDTNATYSFVFADANSRPIELWLARRLGPIIISDWVKTEFYALVGRRIRGGGLTAAAGAIGIADFNAFVPRRARSLTLTASAGALATNLARDPLLKLSAADALHLALAVEGGHSLVTFDVRLAEAARARGHPVESP